MRLISRKLVQDMSQPLPGFVSVSNVSVQGNLRGARVFFRLVGEPGDTRVASEILERERPYFQKLVAQNLRLKFCPVLKFEYGSALIMDETDRLLAELNRDKRFGA